MTFAVGVWKPTVVVFAPLVAVSVLEALPCRRKLCPVAPIVSELVGVTVFTESVVAIATEPVKLAADDIVWPFKVPATETLPVGVTLNLLEPFNCRSSRAPLAARLVLFTTSIGFAAWLEVRVSCPKVGAAVVLIFCTVFTAPLLTVKFVLLKLAIPLAAVVASFMVTVPALAEAFAIVTLPV